MNVTLTKSVLRPFTFDDVESVAYHANNLNIAGKLRDVFPHPYTTRDAEFFIKHVASEPQNIVLAIEVQGKAVGAIGIHPQTDIYRKNAELGYWLGEMYWGMGIITEAVQWIVGYTFEQYPINRIYASVFENNPVSARVLEKCGFKLEAVLKKAIFKNGVTMDEHVYARLLY